jgi:tRNA (mo5U34)-methyltransferase
MSSPQTTGGGAADGLGRSAECCSELELRPEGADVFGNREGAADEDRAALDNALLRRFTVRGLGEYERDMSTDSAPRVASGLEERDVKRQRVSRIPRWWHSIDLGDGVVTPGYKTAAIHEAELHEMDLPSLVHRSVLDIGAWDGFYSFAAEQRGARRVVALDHFVWALDYRAADALARKYQNEGLVPPPYTSVPELWDEEGQPGKAGFDLCHEILGSRVEAVIADLNTMDLDSLGSFDVVLYLGVLYHEPNPMNALMRLRRVTNDLAVIESEMTYFPGLEHLALAEFYPSAELNGDPTNWWVPNYTCLEGLCRASGFRRLEIKKGSPALFASLPPGSNPVHFRGIFHAYVDG